MLLHLLLLAGDPAAAPPAPPTEYIFEINGVIRPESSAYTIERNSFYYEERLASRNNGAITISVDTSVTPEPLIRHGQMVIVTKNGVRMFAGRLRQPKRYMIGLAQCRKRYVSPIVDVAEAFDRRLVIAAFENKTLKEIVDEVNSTFLSGEGFTTTGVETGPLIKKLVIPYKSVKYTFDELARLSGYTYWVNYYNVIQFKERSSVTGPNVTEQNAFKFEATEEVEGYRNIQYFKGGLQLTSVRTELFIGDGTRRTFSIGFTLGKVPTVEENRGAGWVLTQMGIKGLHTGYDWYWNKGSSEITQDGTGVILSVTDQLRVTYQGQFPISYQSEDSTQITERAIAEGHSGRYEAFDQDGSIDDPDVAYDKTVALLERYGLVADRIKFSSYVDGWHAGQLVDVLHLKLGLSGTYMIEDMVVNPESSQKWLYTMTAIGGNSFGMWQEFFVRLEALSATQSFDEGEILQQSTSNTDAVACADVLASTSIAIESRCGFALIDFAEAG